VILPYVETAIAFALVMLAGSLLVNIVVRLIQAYTGERARGVQDMLGQLHRGFCDHRAIAPDDPTAARGAFLDAVLSSPVLHDARTMAAADAELEQGRARAAAVCARSSGGEGAAAAERRRLAADAVVRTARERRRTRLWGAIDYISRDDLLAIVRASASEDGSLPMAWFGGAPVAKPPPTKLQERLLEVVVAPAPARVVGHVSARDFHDYCRRWFATAEATVRQRFSVAARKAGVAVSALVVVLLNLDALRLGFDLYRDRVLAENVARRQGDLVTIAERAAGFEPSYGLDVAQTDGGTVNQAEVGQLGLDLQKTAAVLTIERVPLGWQDAWIVKRWCAYHDACDDPSVPKPTRSVLTIELLMWLLGLLTSWVLLSLGAPFWVGLLKRLGGLANALQGRTAGDPHRTEALAWERESAAPPRSEEDGGVPRWWLDASADSGPAQFAPTSDKPPDR
jgi:hypothetical protein